MTHLLTQILPTAAERFPDRPAFRFLQDELSYAEADAVTNQLAHGLIASGVQKGDRVGIYLNKSLQSPIAMHGIMKSGAAYVPIDPAAPLDRVCQMLSDCQIRRLITDERHRGHVAELARQNRIDAVFGIGPSEVQAASSVESVDSESEDADSITTSYLSWAEISKLSTAPPAKSLGPNDIAYIMYTSGSTGRPKGITHTHQSGMYYAKLAASAYGLECNDRVSNHSPLHFDMSTFDFFSAGVAGAATVIVSEPHMRLPASLSQLMQDESLSVWYSVPFALTQLLYHGVLDQRDLSALRWVLFGGEVFPPRHLQRLMTAWPSARFSNSYGPAEVNQCTYYHVPSAGECDWPEGVPIGKPWPENEILIVDVDEPSAKEIQLVEAGSVGELLVATPSMMTGYWHRPDLNERVFLEHTTSTGENARFYRTGDLVRRLPDGDLAFLGRKDRQVKLRGYRVELDEVESTLLRLPQVMSSAAYVTRREDGADTLEAAVVLHDAGDEPTVSPSSLRDELASQLPAFAVPDTIHIHDVLPLTATGKIDRLALSHGTTDT